MIPKGTVSPNIFVKQAPTADAKINWLRFFGVPIAAVRSELQQDVLSRQVHPVEHGRSYFGPIREVVTRYSLPPERSINLGRILHGRDIAIFTYVCDTTTIYKQGAPEFIFSNIYI
jgi:hypothetical protein